MEFPDDLRGEVVRYLDLPSSGLLRQTARQWNRSKVWCTEDYVKRALSKPVTANEIRSLYGEVEVTKPIFVLTVGMLFREGDRYSAHVQLTIFNPVTMEVRTPAIKVRSNLSHSGHANTSNIYPVGSVNGGVDYVAQQLEREGFYSRSWADPYTTRLIMRRRLINCDVKEPSLWSYFPHSVPNDFYTRDYVVKYDNGDDYADDFPHSFIADTARDLYVLGTAHINGLYDISTFSYRYRFDVESDREEGYLVDDLVEELKSIL